MNPPEIDAATHRALTANIRRFYLYSFLSHFQLWFSIWVLYLQRERGLSLTQITLLDGPFWMVIVLSEVPTGALADRWGRKQSLLLGAVCYAAGIFLFGVSTNYAILLLSYLVWGVSMTLASGADSAFVYDTLVTLGRAGEFQRVLGRAQGLVQVGGLLGSLAGPPLAAATNLATPIVASSAILVAAALVVLTFHEPPHHLHVRPLSYGRIIREAATFSLRHRTLRAMIVLRAILVAGAMAGVIFVQPFLASYDVPVGQFGLFGAPNRLLAIVGAVVAYRLARRLGERTLFYTLSAMTIAALLVLGTVDSVLAVLMFGVLSFANAATIPLASDYINRHSPQQLRATVASFGQMVVSMTVAVSEPVLGVLADRSSLRTAFLAAGAGVAVLCCGALIVWTAALRHERLGSGTSETPAAGADPTVG